VPIVYSVGNLAFDQQFIETFPALAVEARVTRNGVEQVAVRPIFLEDYSPRPLAGDDATRVLRDLAARSAALGTEVDIDAGAGRALLHPAAAPPAASRSLDVTAPLLGAR